MQRVGQWTLWVAALTTLGCGHSESEPGLHFQVELVDVGRLFAGPTLPVVFPFVNGPVPVAVDRLEPSCGCLEPQLIVEGQPLSVPGIVPPGAHGEVRTEYRTAGYAGRKVTGVAVHGAGPGLPVILTVDSILDSWLEVEPQIAEFGVISGEQEQILTLLIRGRGSFRITELLGSAPGVSARGIPSAKSALEQRVDLVIAPSQEEGRHAAFLNFGTDANWSVRVPVSWEIAGRLWVNPSRLLPLGAIRPGVAASTAIEVGAREGELDPPEVTVADLAGIRTEVRVLEAGSRYRIDLTLPNDLPEGTFSGRVQILLRHRIDGRIEEVLREVRLLGVVRA